MSGLSANKSLKGNGVREMNDFSNLTVDQLSYLMTGGVVGASSAAWLLSACCSQ